ncbi:hypothetical protein ACFL1G_04455 [Planctomycetota bacterium]
MILNDNAPPVIIFFVFFANLKLGLRKRKITYTNKNPQKIFINAKGLKSLDEWFIIQKIGLPEKMYRVIEYRARKCLDPVTGKTHIAPIPDEILKGGLLGADVTAAIAFIKGGCHMPYGQLVFSLDVIH